MKTQSQILIGGLCLAAVSHLVPPDDGPSELRDDALVVSSVPILPVPENTGVDEELKTMGRRLRQELSEDQQVLSQELETCVEERFLEEQGSGSVDCIRIPFTVSFPDDSQAFFTYNRLACQAYDEEVRMTSSLQLYIGPFVDSDTSKSSEVQYGQVAFGSDFPFKVFHGGNPVFSSYKTVDLEHKQSFDELDAGDLCEVGVQNLLEPEVDAEFFSALAESYQDFYVVFEEAGLMPVVEPSEQEIAANAQVDLSFLADGYNVPGPQKGFYSENTLRAVYCTFHPLDGRIYCHYGNHFQLTDEGVTSVPPASGDPESGNCAHFSGITLDALIEDPSALEAMVVCE